MGKKNKGGDRMDQWPDYLRGGAQNGWGGHKVQNVRAYRGGTYGPASTCRSLSDAQIAAWKKANGFKC